MSRKELSLVPCRALQQRARCVSSWIKAWCFELWPLLETKWDILDPSVFLPEDLRCMYPSQVWRLVCNPGSAPVPRYSGTIPGTVCPCWLCEHRGKKNWVAGAVQFPLAGRPLQGHNWSEGKVFRGAKNLLCHSSSREIQTAGADPRSAEKHVALTWLGRGQEKCNWAAPAFPWCWGGRHMDTDMANPSSVCSVSIQTSAAQSKREHNITAPVVWRRVGAVCSELLLIWCVFREPGKMPISLWLGKVQTRTTGKPVLLIRDVIFVLKNFLSKWFGFILGKSKISWFSVVVLQGR